VNFLLFPNPSEKQPKLHEKQPKSSKTRDLFSGGGVIAKF